jgi:hypothetical protein
MYTIEKKNGYVYYVKVDSNDGRFKTYYNMGKDPDSEVWKDEINEDELKKNRKGNV